MELTVATILVTFAGVFLICFMKGAFGGGFSIVGIPLLSIVMDPVTAGGLLAPLFIAMDLFALRYWKPTTWSKPDLLPLLPGLVAGIVGAIIGTFAGAELRGRLSLAVGKDLPIALLEDGLAIGGALLIVSRFA